MIRLAGLLLLTSLLWHCGKDPLVEGGGGSEVEVVGQVYLPDNTPAAMTQVTLIPAEYNAALDPPLPDSLSQMTDDTGHYAFADVPPGTYNIQALHIENGTRALVTEIEVTAEGALVADGFLQVPGAVQLLLSNAYPGRGGYAYIPGTEIATFKPDSSTEVFLDSIPAGMVPLLRFMVDEDSSVVTLENLTVTPGDTLTLEAPAWSYSQEIILNTSTTGANIGSDLISFPVLIRLHGGNFDFSRAQPTGADLRFLKPDSTPLAFEIEYWDITSQQAAIWVRTDTLFGNNGTQSIFMLWGNALAADTSQPSSVFAADAGYEGVWHLGEFGNNPAQDATANQYQGDAFNMVNGSFLPGAIGGARSFDGSTSYIQMPGTAASSLDFPEDGVFTLSAWVSLDTLDGLAHAIAAKGYEQYFLRFSYFPTAEPLWEFVDFSNTANWRAMNSPATEGEWTLITGVRNGASQYLYINDVLVDSIADEYPNTFTRDNTNDFTIGRFLEDVTYPLPDGFCFFRGEIDEVRVSNMARSQDWIRLNYINQGAGDLLVQFVD